MNRKPSMVIPALYGGIIMGVISSVPFLNFINCLCCAGILAGGVFAFYFYKNTFTPDTPPFTAGDGMAVGAFAGVFGAGVSVVISLFVYAIFGSSIQEKIFDILQNMDLQIPPEVWERVEEAMSSQMGAFAIISEGFVTLVFDVIFGLLGGLIGYSIWKPKPPMMPPMPPMQPPPPPVVPPQSSVP